jgi:hypothetical protein
MPDPDLLSALSSLGADPAWIDRGLVAPETVLRDAREIARFKDSDLVRFRVAWLREALQRGGLTADLLSALYDLALKNIDDARGLPLRKQISAHPDAGDTLLDRIRRTDPSGSVRGEARAALFRARLARVPWKGAAIKSAELADGDLNLAIEDEDGRVHAVVFRTVARAQLIPCGCVLRDWRIESGGKWVDTIRAEWPRLFGGRDEDPWVVFTAHAERWAPELIVVAQDVEVRETASG